MSLSANAYSGMTHLQDPSEFADDGYGSLMGGGGAKKKKKPVLVLDADELEQAHQAIAMGGQHIMEAEDEPEAMERIRMPSSLLGLAPMGSQEDEDEADYGLSDEGAASFADQEPEEYSEEGLSEEEEMEDDSAFVDLNLDHLLRPASREERDPDDEESIPSIEEQLKKMRALPIQSDEPAAEAESSFDPAPELDEPVAFQPEEAEPLQLESEPQEPVSFEPEDVEPFPTEPEQLDPQIFQHENVGPETEEQEFTPGEPAAAEEVLPQTGAEQDFSASPASEPEAEFEPEAAPETEESWSAPGVESEIEVASAESWSESAADFEPEHDAEQDWSTLQEASEQEPAAEPDQEPVSELPEVEWAPESIEEPLDLAEDAAPLVEPVGEEPAEAAISEETDAPCTDASSAEGEDRWETPEADWSQPESELADPVELSVPAVDEVAEEEEGSEEVSLSFASEEAEEVEEVEAFVPEPEPAPAPEPELPPIPRNALRARVYQMEEERQTRGTSLLGRIWQRLLGR
jgi:hypothetical protein